MKRSVSLHQVNYGLTSCKYSVGWLLIRLLAHLDCNKTIINCLRSDEIVHFVAHVILFSANLAVRYFATSYSSFAGWSSFTVGSDKPVILVLVMLSLLRSLHLPILHPFLSHFSLANLLSVFAKKNNAHHMLWSIYYQRLINGERKSTWGERNPKRKQGCSNLFYFLLHRQWCNTSPVFGV